MESRARESDSSSDYTGRQSHMTVAVAPPMVVFALILLETQKHALKMHTDPRGRAKEKCPHDNTLRLRRLRVQADTENETLNRG